MYPNTEWTPVKALEHWAAVQPTGIFMTQPVAGEAVDYDWAASLDQVRRMAGMLAAQNLPAGSSIALLSRNCAQMILADLAIWMAGHVSVPIYPSLNADTLAYILRHSEARLLFLGPLDDWASMRAGIPESLPTVLFDGAPERAGVNWNDALEQASPLTNSVERRQDELARLVYTSGSTGRPKGVMLSFGSLAAGAGLIGSLIELTSQDRMISYLPLAHVFEAAAVEITALRFGLHVFFSEGLATFGEDLRRARPTVFHSVPRLWLKFQQGVLKTIPPERLEALLADPASAEATRKQVLSQLGLQDARIALSGSAPLSPAIIQWYRDLGLELLEGYAMSEDFAYSHLSRPGRARVGYVGHANEGVERRISPEGEVQIRSPAHMMGYYKEPEKTAEAFTEDGWFRTGDLGEVDEDGRLRITGRLKELFKTSKGKYVAPAPIETRLDHPWVEAVCVGGANQHQPHALLMASPAAAEPLATVEGRAAFEREIESLLERINAGLDPHEALAFAVVVRDNWSIENGMLTPTMKIRRNVIEARYAEAVADWYARGRKVIWEDGAFEVAA